MRKTIQTVTDSICRFINKYMYLYRRTYYKLNRYGARHSCSSRYSVMMVNFVAGTKYSGMHNFILINALELIYQCTSCLELQSPTGLKETKSIKIFSVAYYLFPNNLFFFFFSNFSMYWVEVVVWCDLHPDFHLISNIWAIWCISVVCYVECFFFCFTTKTRRNCWK